MNRIGIGYDLHKLIPGRKLIIGGIEIPSDLGAFAHSDGDILIHALIDALVTPVTGENIGSLFPDDDPRYCDISSMSLLDIVMRKIVHGVEIINIDSVIILDKPKLSKYIPNIKNNIAEILKIPSERVGIKAKTSEKTRPDCIECHTVCLLNFLGDSRKRWV